VKIISENEKSENNNENIEKIEQEENINENVENNFDSEIEEHQNSENNINLIGEDIEDEIISSEDDDIEMILEEESEEEKQARLERELRDFHRCQIEAALYASGKPLSIEELSSKLEIKKKEVEELLNELAFDYLERSTALLIAQIGEKYQMQLKPEYAEKVAKFAKGGAIAEKYLRTLTIIALKQPILKSTLVKLRGSGAYEHVKYLLDNGLISATKKGRSYELTTTDKYAEMFGLPKDKEQMKRIMIAQLGLEPNSN